MHTTKDARDGHARPRGCTATRALDVDPCPESLYRVRTPHAWSPLALGTCPLCTPWRLGQAGLRGGRNPRTNGDLDSSSNYGADRGPDLTVVTAAATIIFATLVFKGITCDNPHENLYVYGPLQITRTCMDPCKLLCICQQLH